MAPRLRDGERLGPRVQSAAQDGPPVYNTLMKDDIMKESDFRSCRLVLIGQHLLGEQLHFAFLHEHVNAVLVDPISSTTLLEYLGAPVFMWGTNHRKIVRDSIFLRRKGFKLNRYWIGGDVLSLNNMHRSKSIFHIWLNKLLFDFHFTTSEWLTKELMENGLRSIPVPFSSICCPDHHPIAEFPPKPLRVVFYSIEDCDHIYQPKFIQKCADMLPEVEFICCGNKKLGIFGKNIRNMGLIESHKMMDLYASSHCLLRVTTHDGFARSILEALSYGLYVITNQPIPYTEQVADVQSAVTAIRRIDKLGVRNHHARQWALENYSAKAFVNNIMKYVSGNLFAYVNNRSNRQGHRGRP
jgi:glycosyltransferase involved in cell wall biosynthesis